MHDDIILLVEDEEIMVLIQDFQWHLVSGHDSELGGGGIATDDGISTPSAWWRPWASDH